jgi:hypothetical protein
MHHMRSVVRCLVLATFAYCRQSITSTRGHHRLRQWLRTTTGHTSGDTWTTRLCGVSQWRGELKRCLSDTSIDMVYRVHEHYKPRWPTIKRCIHLSWMWQVTSRWRLPFTLCTVDVVTKVRKTLFCARNRRVRAGIWGLVNNAGIIGTVYVRQVVDYIWAHRLNGKSHCMSMSHSLTAHVSPGRTGMDDWLSIDDYRQAMEVNFFGAVRYVNETMH